MAEDEDKKSNLEEAGGEAGRSAGKKIGEQAAGKLAGSGAGSAATSGAGTAGGGAAAAGGGAAAAGGGAAAGGAAAGATAGSVVPGVGTAVGGVAGAVGGAVLVKFGKYAALAATAVAALIGSAVILVALFVVVIVGAILSIIFGGVPEAGAGTAITVTKTADPFVLDNDGPGTNAEVEYTITIKNNLDFPIVDVVVADDKCPDIDRQYPELGPKDTETIVESCIVATEEDRIHTNTVTVTGEARAEDGDGNVIVEAVDVTVSASVTIGDVQQCYDFSDPSWTDPSDLAAYQEVATFLAQSPEFMSKLCVPGSVVLKRSITASAWGQTNGANGITLYGPVNTGFNTRLYILSHESGHVIGNFNGLGEFISSGVYEADGGLVPTYLKDFGLPGVNCSPSQINVPISCYDESYAEMISDFIIYKFYSFGARGWSGYPGGVWNNHPSPTWDSFNTDWNAQYEWAKTNIFGGSVF